MTKAQVAQEKKWQIEGDLRTLQESIEILGDKKRLEAAKKLAVEKEDGLEYIQKINDEFMDVCGINK